MRAVPYVIGGAGLVVSIIGTFLPWLRSGEVRRNSYASFGVLRRLIGFHGPADIAVRAWPALGLACAVVVVVAVAGLVRVAAVLGFVVAGWSAAVGGAALAHDPEAGVRTDAIGPIVTIAGSATVAVAAILTLSSRARRRGCPEGGS